MTKVLITSPDGQTGELELKDPATAAFLAWLIPGAGHFYQGRTAKGVLFMTCILSTFIFGLVIGQGRVVYASFRQDDLRLPYLCQVGVGLPALPALVQAYRVKNDREPLGAGYMAPPKLAPPGIEGELSKWEKKLGRRFELGTVYTMIAGLLNLLAIYDAWGGPAQLDLARRKEDEDKDKKATPPPGPPPTP